MVTAVTAVCLVFHTPAQAWKASAVLVGPRVRAPHARPGLEGMP